MFDQFVELCYSSIHFISDKIENKKLERNLNIARINYTLSEYLSVTIALGVFISIFFTLIIFRFETFFISFFICFLISTNLPKKVAESYQKKVENELLAELQTIYLELKMNIDFETVLKKRVDKTKLGKEFSIMCSKIKHGKTMQIALNELSESFNSEFIDQIVAQLIMIYEQGNQNIESLKKIGKAKNEENLIKLKEKNQKQGYYSILFVASSTVFPAMFQAYLIIGSSFLELNYSETIWLSIIVFLGINLLIMVKMYAN